MGIAIRFTLFTLAALSPVCIAQPHLERVTPGIGDIGPSSVDPRIIPPDLRQPVGFEGVYRLGDRAPGPGFDARPLVRVSGATIAVFPRSTYRRTSVGTLPMLPAGTVFYLGQVPENALDPAERPLPASFLANPLGSDFLRPLNLAFQEPANGLSQPQGAAPPAGDLMTNEQLRQARIASLLAAAARSATR